MCLFPGIRAPEPGKCVHCLQLQPLKMQQTPYLVKLQWLDGDETRHPTALDGNHINPFLRRSTPLMPSAKDTFSRRSQPLAVAAVLDSDPRPLELDSAPRCLRQMWHRMRQKDLANPLYFVLHWLRMLKSLNVDITAEAPRDEDNEDSLIDDDDAQQADLSNALDRIGVLVAYRLSGSNLTSPAGLRLSYYRCARARSLPGCPRRDHKAVPQRRRLHTGKIAVTRRWHGPKTIPHVG